MKTRYYRSKLSAIALMGITAAIVSLYPAMHTIGAVQPPAIQPGVIDPAAVNRQQGKIDVVFVLDTTGSMSGLIKAAKEKIWSIASTMAQAEHAPEIRMGLVAYRDRGDEYVTRVTDLSHDLDSMYATLMDYRAAGGGDTPESVNQALHDAVHKISWSRDSNTYRAIFLVGDAPPHMDYQDDVKYPQTLGVARERGIVVNTIQSGNYRGTSGNWKQIASLGQGRYFHVTQSGDAVAIATPFDAKLAKLSAELDDTRMYYGDRAQREQMKRKVEAGKKLQKSASVTAQARRARFNASRSGEKNLIGKNELVDSVASGRVSLADIDRDQLPAAIRAMAPSEQEAVIEAKAKKRREVTEEIRKLSRARSDYLREKVAETGGAKDSLDEKIYSAVRDQAAKSGLSYKAESAEY